MAKTAIIILIAVVILGEMGADDLNVNYRVTDDRQGLMT